MKISLNSHWCSITIQIKNVKWELMHRISILCTVIGSLRQYLFFILLKLLCLTAGYTTYKLWLCKINVLLCRHAVYLKLPVLIYITKLILEIGRYHKQLTNICYSSKGNFWKVDILMVYFITLNYPQKVKNIISRSVYEINIAYSPKRR